LRAAASALILGVCISLAAPAFAQKGVAPTSVTVGGKPMMSDQDIVENLSQSADHTVLLALLNSAGMVDALRSHGPFTVFAPTNAAFAALAPGLLDSLRRPENKPALVALLSMQIVPGIYSSARLHFLQRGKGQTELDTVSGGKLVVGQNGPTNLVLRDSKGDTAAILIYDAKQANGVIFVTDRVMQPG
jgi:uncharacterized surface protein with fasciclin (FAS1) repeats